MQESETSGRAGEGECL